MIWVRIGLLVIAPVVAGVALAFVVGAGGDSREPVTASARTEYRPAPEPTASERPGPVPTATEDGPDHNPFPDTPLNDQVNTRNLPDAEFDLDDYSPGLSSEGLLDLLQQMLPYY
ncbi:MAG: hypothetical protein WEB00_09150 [Dehalococcoidia bacterium]